MLGPLLPQGQETGPQAEVGSEDRAEPRPGLGTVLPALSLKTLKPRLWSLTALPVKQRYEVQRQPPVGSERARVPSPALQTGPGPATALPQESRRGDTVTPSPARGRPADN